MPERSFAEREIAERSTITINNMRKCCLLSEKEN